MTVENFVRIVRIVFEKNGWYFVVFGLVLTIFFQFKSNDFNVKEDIGALYCVEWL